MKKRYQRILEIIVVTIFIFLTSTSMVEANVEERTIMDKMYIAKETKVDNFDGIKDKADAFVNSGKDKGNDYVDPIDLHDIIQPIAQILVAVGTVLVSVVTLVMGIKYIMAAPDEKGKLKQSLIGLVVATIVIYGAQGIWALVYNFMTSVTG